jgi:hypothetical protein
MTELERVLIDRDGMSLEEAREEIAQARIAVLKGEDPEEVLNDWFGLEPDYIFDLI